MFLALALAGVAAPVAVAAQTTPVAESASPVGQALRNQVGSKLRDFYRARGYWPLWIDGDAPGPQAAALIDVIETTGIDGLDPRRYDAERLRRVLAAAEAGDPRTLATAELMLSAALADLVRDMREPHIAIKYLDDSLQPGRLKPDEVLRRAALAPSMANYVRRLGWMNPLYAQLREALADAGGDPAAGDEDPTVPVAAGPLLKPGATDDRIGPLRRRLGLDDDVIVFDDALLARVKRFQASRGLPADGVVGARTIAALNGDAPDRDAGNDRRDVLRLNLERARLLPDAWTRHVVVDAAGSRLWYFGEGSEAGSMRVVTGTPETPTPMMAGMIRYATLNPYWNVPVDLVRKRIAPKVLAGQSLQKQGYEALSDWTADAHVIDASTIDWRGVEAGSVEPRVRELPGLGNSMGSVKFMFPNDLGIYLHDTPQKNLFAKPDRHFSNGCIRLEDAARLGAWLFDRPLKPDSSAPEQHVAVPQPVPVYLMYFTASPTGEDVRYVADVYHRDAPALEHLASR